MNKRRIVLSANNSSSVPKMVDINRKMIVRSFVTVGSNMMCEVYNIPGMVIISRHTYNSIQRDNDASGALYLNAISEGFHVLKTLKF